MEEAYSLKRFHEAERTRMLQLEEERNDRLRETNLENSKLLKMIAEKDEQLQNAEQKIKQMGLERLKEINLDDSSRVAKKLAELEKKLKKDALDGKATLSKNREVENEPAETKTPKGNYIVIPLKAPEKQKIVIQTKYDYKIRCLETHNAFRRVHGCPKLKLNDYLNRLAMQKAQVRKNLQELYDFQ